MRIFYGELWHQLIENLLNFCRFKTLNGIHFSQDIVLDPNKGTPYIEGEYGNSFSDGSTVQVSFTADEYGFLPRVTYRAAQPISKNIPDLTNRIPTSAIATLSGGGMG